MDLDVITQVIPKFINGAVITIEMTAISVTIGFFLAILVAIMRVSKKPYLWMPSYGFSFYVRGTPLLVQLFLIYYGSGQFKDFLDSIGLWYYFKEAWFCALLALTLNTTAYSSEIFRGGIQGVSFGEIEAGRAYGMSGIKLYRRIILPSALRIAWPAYTNEVVFQLQVTSLVSIITLMDLTGVARVEAARTFAFYEIFLTVAAIYLVLVYGVIFVFKKIENKINAHLNLGEAAIN
ncbi:MAG: ABC transporter permease [Thermodesulfobacteriota bacterium]|nr:ABC transporter permease [Thermodesulfobacteriota bacterium]